MNFPKFVNKKTIIFVVLFIAFVYFSGIFHYMREGLTLDNRIIKNIDCSGCHISSTNPKCNTNCSKLNYKNFNCRYNGKDTVCKNNIMKPNTLIKRQVKK